MNPNRHGSAPLADATPLSRSAGGEIKGDAKEQRVYSFLVYSFLLLSRKQSGGQVAATDGKSRYTACYNEADICW